MVRRQQVREDRGIPNIKLLDASMSVVRLQLVPGGGDTFQTELSTCFHVGGKTASTGVCEAAKFKVLNLKRWGRCMSRQGFPRMLLM